MHGVTITIIIVVILKRLNLTSCLVELSPIGDNVIATEELLLRATFNRLLNVLKVPENITELEGKFSLVLLNVTLQDSKTFKDMVEITRPSIVKENEENYMDLINDILNEDNSNSTDSTQDEKTLQVINNFMDKLEHLKSQYNPDDVNKLSINPIKDTLDNIIDDGENSLDISYENHTSPYWIPDDELESSNYRRVYQGKGTRIKNFPFVVAVLLFQMFYCAGSIISSDLIITAASCLQLAWNNRLFRENPAFISVRVGSSFHAGGGEKIPVQEVYFHPNYDPKTLYGNLCILRLQKHLKFSGKKKKRIKKIMYDTKDHALPMNTPGVMIIGWGANQASNVIKFTDPLRFAILDIYSLRDCQDIYSKKYVKRENFCAGFISKGSGACNHDVGNPGIVGGVLVGVVSFGSPVCGTPDAPTVFTKVGFYSDWIEDIIELDVPTKLVRTTKMTPWTLPTYSTTTASTLMPFPPFLDWLRTYYMQDENLSNGLVKKLKKEDNLLVDAIQHIDMVEDQTITPINEEMQTTVETETSFTEEFIFAVQSDSDGVIGHTKTEPFIDTFETYIEKDYKKKRHPKHRHHIERTRKPKQKTTTFIFKGTRKPKKKSTYAIFERTHKAKKKLTPAVLRTRKRKKKTTATFVNVRRPINITPSSIFEEIRKPKIILDNYDYINVVPREFYEPLSLPAKEKSNKQYQHRGKDSINYITTSHDLKNLMPQNQKEEFEYKDAAINVFNSLEDEIPLHTSTVRTSQVPRVTLLNPRISLDRKTGDEIDNYDEHPKILKNGDQVEAEEFFTHSILDYLTQRKVHPNEKMKGDIIKSQESNEQPMNRANSWAEFTSDNDVTYDSPYDTSIKINVSKNEEDEKYIAYLKSLNPPQFYKLLSLAISEIERELMKP